ncbi:Laccase 3 [Tripterygium wilfordii]|uniref:laccase n=1 Tax=Tripterygium wilfordii TaxID=458696 RepID=A0A7J7DYB4_TRIWF|nr:Laccase 3 [Tripterygium wilfordii]
MDVLKLATFTGAQPNISDAYTINGQPGDLYRCSKKGLQNISGHGIEFYQILAYIITAENCLLDLNAETVIFPVNAGETILLRIINSAMNQELFFAVANHALTVVGVDAAYTRPFTTNVIMIAPGQTTNVLLTANQPPARYYMAAHAYNTANAPFDNTTTTAILSYKEDLLLEMIVLRFGGRMSRRVSSLSFHWCLVAVVLVLFIFECYDVGALCALFGFCGSLLCSCLVLLRGTVMLSFGLKFATLLFDFGRALLLSVGLCC